MSIYIIKNHENTNRLGISVGKKYSKSSVIRNRIRRIIKESYRLNEEKIVTGNDIIIMWKNNAKCDIINYELINNDLIKCLKKANLLTIEEDVNA